MSVSILQLVILIFFGAILLSAGTLFAADSKSGWQATWEKTVAAAKKEGKLNFFAGHYGKYADMTPMFNLIKEIMKGREERKG
jgi:hypothetical protein